MKNFIGNLLILIAIVFTSNIAINKSASALPTAYQCGCGCLGGTDGLYQCVALDFSPDCALYYNDIIRFKPTCCPGGVRGTGTGGCAPTTAPVYYCEATTSCPTGVVNVAASIADATDNNLCCSAGQTFNTTTGNCDVNCQPATTIPAFGACTAPIGTSAGNQTRDCSDGCGGTIKGCTPSQTCVAPLVCPADQNPDVAAGVCVPQCTGLLENQVCFKTSQTVAGGLSELFQLNKNAEGYTSPNVHSCFKAGVVDFTPVAKTDLDYGRKFNISCGKIANAITSGATTAVDNGSVRDINGVVR